MSGISTPCTKLCVLDERTGLCLGCGRSRGEIARWGRMTEAERRALMAGLAARRRAAFGEGSSAGAAGAAP